MPCRASRRSRRAITSAGAAGTARTPTTSRSRTSSTWCCGYGRRLFARDGQPAPRARVARLGEGQAAEGQGARSRPGQPCHQRGRASRAGRRAHRPPRQAGRARQRDREHRLRLRAGAVHAPGASLDHVGEAARGGRGRPAGDARALAPPGQGTQSRGGEKKSVSRAEKASVGWAIGALLRAVRASRPSSGAMPTRSVRPRPSFNASAWRCTVCSARSVHRTAPLPTVQPRANPTAPAGPPAPPSARPCEARP